jgi:DNA polymerase-3 subunit epsilon
MNPRRRVARRALVIDVETTGLDPARHACIEIGAVLLDESLDVVWEFSASLLPPPDAEICAEAQQIHRIALAESQRGEPAEKVIRAFHHRISSESAPVVVAGWNVWFDVSFLKVLYRRAGIDWSFGHRFLDVQSIVSFAEDLRDVSQASVIENYLGETQTHRALADARQTARLLRQMSLRL